MNGRFFSKSLKLLFVALLVLLAFFHDPKYQWMYFAVFGAWIVCLLLRSLFLCFKRLKRGRNRAEGKRRRQKAERVKRRKRPTPRPAIQAETDPPVEKLLLSHLNHRITDKLKAVFPDAAWQWEENDPVRIARGGTGRIRVDNAGEYTHADVTVDGYMRISLVMMKRTSLQDAAESAHPDPDETDNPVSVADWFEWVGKDALNEVITELNTRGYARVFVKEDGSVYVVEDGDEAVKTILKEMPGKSKWPELVKVLAAGDLRGEIDNDRLVVSWA